MVVSCPEAVSLNLKFTMIVFLCVFLPVGTGQAYKFHDLEEDL